METENVMNRDQKKITVYDIAGKLGVSPSTVTRALNNNPCISEATRAAVQAAAKEMGYRKNTLAPLRKSVHMALILRNKFGEYQSLIAAGARHACAACPDCDATIDVCMLDVLDYDRRLAEKVRELSDAGCQGVILGVFSKNAAQSVDALIRERSLHASTLYCDYGMENLDFFVSPDNRCSGRMAVDLFAMHGLKKGDRVAYLTGSCGQAHHQQNLDGFMEMNERYGFDVRVLEHQDNSRIAYYVTEQVLTEQPDIRGVYCSTAVTPPVCDRLIEAGRGEDVVVIGTELLTNCIPYLESNVLNAVIFQNPFKLGYLSAKTMLDCIRGSRSDGRAIYINPQIVIRGNMAYYEKRITDIDSEV